MSFASTRGVEVRVQPRFHPEHSDPARSHWFFSYTVEVRNTGDETVQLVSRRWQITDATGHIEVVEGPGVVGEQPVLAPGEAFSYTSYCPLPTSLGAMEGTYRMVRTDGSGFDADVAAFTLTDPDLLH